MDQADIRFFGFAGHEWRPRADGKFNVHFNIYDGDTRRWLKMTVVGVHQDQTEAWSGSTYVAGWAPIHSALGAGIDSGRLGPDVTAVEITFDGTILSAIRDADLDVTPYVHYLEPDRYELPQDLAVETVARDQLDELGRLAPWVDTVATPPSTRSEKLVFKHYSDTDGIPRAWLEIQWLARLSGHPNIIPLRHLVVAEGYPEGKGGVVGFTIPFLDGGSLETSQATTRPFKLKWAKQLCQVIDDLNLHHGIAHTDVRPRNIMVDDATDNLVLVDFGTATRRGNISQRGVYVPPVYHNTSPPVRSGYTKTDAPVRSGYTKTDAPDTVDPQFKLQFQLEPARDAAPKDEKEEERGEGKEETEENAGGNDLAMQVNRDVASAIVLVHGLLTRSVANRDKWAVDPVYTDLLNGRGTDALVHKGPWIAHPDALLDHPAEDYRAVLVDWLARRRANPGHYQDHTHAPQPFVFPDHMPIPGPEEVQDLADAYNWCLLRRDAVRSGRAIVEWVRPATVALDRSRTLLATGKYLEGDEGGKEPEPKPKAKRTVTGDDRRAKRRKSTSSRAKSTLEEA